MSWASRRRSKYIGIVVAVALVIIVPLFFVVFNKKPTCTDGKQNGDEVGIDCGGLCPELCVSQISDPILIWSRSFKVVDGVYNAVAYVENPNFNAGISKISYTFKLFDGENVLVAERKGSTFISPNNVSPIFEGGIKTGERVPTKTFFELSQGPVWTQSVDEDTSLSVSDTVLSEKDSSPRIDATLSNSSVSDVRDIEVVAIVFDSKDNAIAVSSTFVELLSKRSSRNIVFTWPDKFESIVSRIEIIPRVPVNN
jgi:hypothetical protein